MAGTLMTYLICYDDKRSFTEEVRKRFSDETRYNVTSFHSRQEFIENCGKVRNPGSCKVALIVVPDAKDQFEMIDEMTLEVKRIDLKIGLILLIPGDKMEDLKKVVKFNIDAYIPKSPNAVLRIHNAVKKLISEQGITVFRRKRNFSLYVLLAFLLLSAILVLVAFFKLPQYF
jgi:DNA-binding NarL/FixJ family response regulator